MSAAIGHADNFPAGFILLLSGGRSPVRLRHLQLAEFCPVVVLELCVPEFCVYAIGIRQFYSVSP